MYYEAMPGEETLCHMSLSKLLCRYDDVETVYAAKILSDYLTGSNEAPLKRAFLERGLAQDVTLEISDGIYQPSAALIVRNTTRDAFDKVKTLAAEVARDMFAAGLDRASLSASLERFAFTNREITEPYGVELACPLRLTAGSTAATDGVYRQRRRVRRAARKDPHGLF